MAKIPRNLTDLNQGVEIALEFAQVSMDCAERVMRMQLEAAKKFVAQQSTTAKVLVGMKDEQELAALRAQLVEQAVEGLLGYTHDVYAVASQTQRELAKMVEQRFAAYRHEMTAAMEKLIKAAPAGSDPAVEALRSTMAATSTAIENMTKAAHQAAALADANVKAMTKTAANALKSGTKQG